MSTQNTDPVKTDDWTSAPEPVDVVAIMEEVRRRVAEKRAAGIYPAANMPPTTAITPDADDNELMGKVRWGLDSMYASARIGLEGEPITSHRPVAGFFLKSWKKFLRFWVRRYTDTLFLQQSYFNTETANTVAALHEEIRRLRREIEQLREK